MSNVIVYSKPGCPSCESAKRKLTSMKVPFDVKTLGTDLTPDQMFEEFDANGWERPRTAPQIVINGELVGGYEAMLKYIEDTGFNGTGHTI